VSAVRDTQVYMMPRDDIEDESLLHTRAILEYRDKKASASWRKMAFMMLSVALNFAFIVGYAVRSESVPTPDCPPKTYSELTPASP
jgi:hypothetical protein